MYPILKSVVKYLLSFILCVWVCLGATAQRSSQTLKKGWQFSRDSVEFQNVTIPHDWAIYGPFDRQNDIQHVAIEQNGEATATWKTGRSGGLPYAGRGLYRTVFNVPEVNGKNLTLLVDGAMSHARVSVNGQEVAYWPYGYNSFYVDITPAVRVGQNTLEIALDNKEKSSRWYPGAGLYRNVHLITTDTIHIPVWGTQVTTPFVSPEYATVRLRTEIEGVPQGSPVTLNTIIRDPQGRDVAGDTHLFHYRDGAEPVQILRVDKPELWSPETPALYTATTQVITPQGRIADEYVTRFGIREAELRPGDGFYLNGEKRKFKGVCLHHDLGPLGAAVNRSAIEHQLRLLRDAGVDAIRTSHNMPAPELVAAADSMGFMLMIEPFDDWAFRPKCENGYGTLFPEWAERDVVNMVRHYRNSPAVVLWSIGNEVPSQWGPDGVAELTMLQDIVHREDPTRPVTCGMDQFDAVVNNGFAAALDIPGFNYKVNRYDEAIPLLPQNLLLGTETASTVSSRGRYFFPVVKGAMIGHEGNQCSSYDTEYCSWSNLPDDDFAADDDKDYNLGQFVWTGFDYLGEPTPYDDEGWPSHSSMFGMIDLASIPKDRFYLYRSKWNERDNTLHILPHWTWPGREGEVTPVFVYTNSPRAELFINGRSQGLRAKNDSTNMTRYRLMWDDVVYEPGELRVVTYDELGNPTGEGTVRTAGTPHHLVLSSSRDALRSDGEDLAYITIQVADEEGNLVPTDEREVRFKVAGAGAFRATANGDPTSLRPFHEPVMDLFSGAATVIVRSGERPGTLSLTVETDDLPPATIDIPVK